MNCKNENIKCSNLVLRKATKGKYIGQEFFGCSLYPECSYQIPLHFNPDIMSDNDKELARAFGLFVRSNYFIYATFGVVYYNLKSAGFLDYLLKTDIVYMAPYVEVGLSGAKIYHELFANLFLIPENQIKRYLVNNFPNNYNNLHNHGPVHTLLGIVDDYDTFEFEESLIYPYRDITTIDKNNP